MSTSSVFCFRRIAASFGERAGKRLVQSSSAHMIANFKLAKVVAATAVSLLLHRPDDKVVDTLEIRCYKIDSDRSLKIDLRFTLADVGKVVDFESVDPCSIWK